MTKDHALYLGVFGLLVSILNLTAPIIRSKSLALRNMFYQTKFFIFFETYLTNTLDAAGSTKDTILEYKTKHYSLFWILFLTTAYISLVTREWIFLIIVLIYPLWIAQSAKSKLEKRNKEISKAFPYFLDLLILCLESGMDNLRSIKEIIKGDTENPLYIEMQWVLQSTQIGQTLPKAMSNAANRTQSEGLQYLANAIAQSSELGSSLAEILRMQSATLRDKIFKQAQEQAQKAPVRILFPLIFFIFPVVFIILFFPIATQFMTSL